jgi:hypothetical protein
MYILGEKERAVDYDCSSENIRLVSHVALNSKTLEGFAGVMRKYCSKRRGPIFTEVFIQLLDSFDDGNNDTVGTATKEEKLMALLENQISTTTATKAIYEDMGRCYSLPSLDGQLRSLRRFVDEQKVDQIALQNRGKLAVYCRGISLMQERQSRRKRNHRYVLKAFHENSF